MALIKCVDCGKDISDKAKACPHCGCPIEESTKDVVKEEQTVVEVTSKPKKNIKKIIVLFAVLFVMACCGGLVALNFMGVGISDIKCFIFGCSEPIETYSCNYDEDVFDPIYNYLEVITDYINVRVEPSSVSTKLIQVCRGNKFNVIDTKDIGGVLWFKIIYNDEVSDATGWVVSKYNAESYIGFYDVGSRRPVGGEKTATTTKNNKTTTKKTTTKNNGNTTKKTTTKGNTTKVTTKATTKATTTKKKGYSISSINGVGKEYKYFNNVCLVEDLNVSLSTSPYSDYLKMKYTIKYKKMSNTTGACRTVLNFYDEDNIKIKSISAVVTDLAQGEVGKETEDFYSSIELKDIVGSKISVKIVEG